MFLPVILAGGCGSRLWPLSRGNFPKQFLTIQDDGLSLQASAPAIRLKTITRLKGLNHAAPMLICNEEHRFIALMGNEVGAIFLKPDFHGHGIGAALMNKARQLHGDLVVEVFKENTLGRNFYAKYGFEFVEETFHQPTSQTLLRLQYYADL